MSVSSSLPANDQPSSHIQALAALGIQRRYRSGALLIQEGETGDTIYIVLQGRLRAFLGDGLGSRRHGAVFLRMDAHRRRR